MFRFPEHTQGMQNRDDAGGEMMTSAWIGDFRSREIKAMNCITAQYTHINLTII